MTSIDRPEVVEDKHLKYLDELRTSGKTSMYGSTSFIRSDFDLSPEDSRIIVKFWMDSYFERMKEVSKNESP